MDITRTANTDTTTWAAVQDGAEIAWLSIWTANREIANVEVRAAHQRHGHAAALYRQADTEAPIFHTISAHRTQDGNAFAAHVGGQDIDEDDALVIDSCCCDHCDT